MKRGTIKRLYLKEGSAMEGMYAKFGDFTEYGADYLHAVVAIEDY